MLTIDYTKTIGEYTYISEFENEREEYRIQIHPCNALCAMIHHGQNEDGEKVATLISFYTDEKHIKNCVKSGYDLLGKAEDVELNTYYKETAILVKYLTRQGYAVKCYYKEETK